MVIMAWFASEVVLAKGPADRLVEQLIAAAWFSHAATNRYDGQVVVTVYHDTAQRASVLDSSLAAIDGGIYRWRATGPVPDPMATPVLAGYPVVALAEHGGEPLASAAAASGAPIVLATGAGWGDGRHPTTQAAADLLAACRLQGGHTLDIGCGSGLLSVVAGRAGAGAITAGDCDPSAVTQARQTCTLNRISPVEVVEAAGLDAASPGRRYAMIIINCWADVIAGILADHRWPEVMAHDAEVVVAGIAGDQWPGINDLAARSGLVCRERRDDGWWVAARWQRGAGAGGSRTRHS